MEPPCGWLVLVPIVSYSVERFLFSPYSCHMNENDPLLLGFGNRFEEIPMSVLVSVRGQKRSKSIIVDKTVKYRRNH